MDAQLKQLLEKARESKVSDEEREAQRISFAFGNSHFENEDVTRETVIRESAKIKSEQADR